MRRFIALAIAGAVAIGVVSFAIADENVQTITAKITPSQLSETRYHNAKLFVDVETQSDNPLTSQPPEADRTLVDFPKNLRFNLDAVPQCNVDKAALENTTTEQAIAACGADSVVSIASGSKAEVIIDDADGDNSDAFLVHAQVTAFNGKQANSLYLHARAQEVPITTVLFGKLKDGPTGYGKRLDVTIPDLAAGAISSFKVLVKNGKFVQARCRSTTNKFQATTMYASHPTTVDTFKSHCTRS